ncbi:MAG: DUF5995 family protein [Gemmatimonadota bacterium]
MSPHATVTDRMRHQIRQWEDQGDRRAIFLSCYALMTDNMLAALHGGRFQDTAWVERLLHRFAGYYFDALDCYDCGEPPAPQVWRQVHEASRHRPLHVLQHLLLGMNAHINYDLVLTLDELLRPEWGSLDEADRRKRLADHRQVNAIIAETIDLVQDSVVERHDPALEIADLLLGPFDERILSLLVSRWREEVWEKAVELLKCPERGGRRRGIRSRLEADVLRRGELLLRFG